MTLDRRLLLSSLLLLIFLMAFGLFVVEARHHPREEVASEARHRHRHRHRHESSNGKRNRHDLVDGRRSSSWSQVLDYEDDSLGEEQDDYDAAPYYERPYPRTPRIIGPHGRMLETRYSAKYRRGGSYRGTGGWYEQDEERRKASPRYPSRGYRARSDRTYRRLGHSRSREQEYEEYEDDQFDYEKPSRGYEDDRRHRSWWKNGKKLRIPFSHDWRPDSRKRHHPDDLQGSRRFDNNWRKFNSTESRYFFRTNRKNMDRPEDYDYPVDGYDDTEKDEEEEEIGRESEEEDQNEDEEEDENEEDEEEEEEDHNEDNEEFDNDFYKRDKKAPLKTYDDIIRRLTSDEPITVRTTIKRDYRNIVEAERHAKRNALENFKYEPRNLSRSLVHDRGLKFAASSYIGFDHQSVKKIVENPSSKLFSSPVDRKLTKNASNADDRQEKKIVSKMDDSQARTKSLEQDYDEYVNTPDNEKEEDLVKAGVEEDSAMQADVTNTDYTEDEDEDETPPTTTTSTTSTTTTTTTTTTTPKPVVTQNYDYRDSRGHEGGTGAQYNGYQSKSDYPPMSAHSAHKWQTLGTRESVKETRSNMQQYNKNGKTAEIREALQHAIKVSREGSCQWPRPRVIPVRDVYPSPSTTYIPHCAILHRCSDDTGCCRSEALTCVPKHSHRVELSFYTTNVGGSSVVEKLSFYNHTECECREKTEYDTTNEKPSEQRVYRHYAPSLQPQNMRRTQPRKPCRCPSEFTPRITSDGECQCNCYETDQNCIKIRRGKGFFSLSDRLCIQNDECALPSCEFGEYMRRQGKCPRKKDKFDKIANYHRNPSHWYRS